jgi:nanoRNase/pAp phosphatase (c-di-AMP/oligoRNAs hydrolase)
MNNEVEKIIKKALDLREYEKKQVMIALLLSMLEDISAHEIITFVYFNEDERLNVSWGTLKNE